MKRNLCLLLLLALWATAQAAIKLPEIIGNDMVLQQRTQARLWGKADAGATVSADADWLGQPVTTQADKNGNWSLMLPTPAAAKQEHRITLMENGLQQVVLERVLIGEVWFASGQSNMEMPKPVEEVPGKWLVPTPETAPWMSATGFFFGQMLQRVLDIPVGVIACAWGGSKVEGWVPEEIVKTYDDINIAKEQKEGWNGSWWHYYTPVIMYNGMLHPLRHYTIRGFIWYQGESNVGKEQTYAQRLKDMVDTWRKEFGGTAQQMPFYLVEIAPWGGYGEWLSSPLLREAQHNAAQLIENCGIVSTNDLVKPYEFNQIHPAQKREVGNRLAYMALNRTYGYKSIACDSPEYDHMEIKGNEVEVFFKNADDGLSPWQDIEGFEIAGADGAFKTAKATLNESHKSIMVSSSEVPQPVAVRYCFKSFQIGNLKNMRGLPVVPFRTDK